MTICRSDDAGKAVTHTTTLRNGGTLGIPPFSLSIATLLEIALRFLRRPHPTQRMRCAGAPVRALPCRRRALLGAHRIDYRNR